MAIVVVMILYSAWLITWSGTGASTCTMGDYESLPGAMILSFPFYLGAIATLPRVRFGVVGLLLALPLVPLMAWQAIWGVKLFLLVNVARRHACGLMSGGGHWHADGTWLEASLAPYYTVASLGSLAALAVSHWRYRQGKRSKLQVDASD